MIAGAGVGTLLALASGLAVAAVGGVYLWIVLNKALARAGATRVRSGPQGLIGRVGEVRAAPAPLGKVFLDGALWKARLWCPEDEEAKLASGDPIVVERVDGLTLTVRRAEDWELAPMKADGSMAVADPPRAAAVAGGRLGARAARVRAGGRVPARAARRRARARARAADPRHRPHGARVAADADGRRSRRRTSSRATT